MPQWKYTQCKVLVLWRASSLLITSMGNSFVRVVLFQINFQGFQLIENKLNIRYRAILKLRYDPELKSVVMLLEMPRF